MDIINLNNYKYATTVNSINSTPQGLVNFKGGTGIDGNRLRKALSGISCPCCGITMLSSKEIGSALKYPSNEPSEVLIPVLGRFQNQLHHTEKDIFYTLKSLSGDYPDLNLRELLNMERDMCLDVLLAEEWKIINKIRKIGVYLGAVSKRKLENILNETEKLIRVPKITAPFKRRTFIAKIADVAYRFPEKDVAQLILDTTRELPKAGNSKPAFVVKYTQKKPDTGVERDSNDIIKGMLFPSLATIEHVKVRSSKFSHGGGKNESANYILECQRDNNLRDSKPFVEFILNNPRFYGIHLQKYIDIVISKVNNGELRGLENYPREIAKTLKKQSKGLLQVDISKLKQLKDIKTVQENKTF